jgi:hypothetical protein
VFSMEKNVRVGCASGGCKAAGLGSNVGHTPQIKKSHGFQPTCRDSSCARRSSCGMSLFLADMRDILGGRGRREMSVCIRVDSRGRPWKWSPLVGRRDGISKHEHEGKCSYDRKERVRMSFRRHVQRSEATMAMAMAMAELAARKASAKTAVVLANHTTRRDLMHRSDFHGTTSFFSLSPDISTHGAEGKIGEQARSLLKSMSVFLPLIDCRTHVLSFRSLDLLLFPDLHTSQSLRRDASRKV